MITREEFDAERAAGGFDGDDVMPPVHPGEILREEFLKPLGMTPYALSKRMHVPQNRLTAILAGKRALTADTAMRLAKVFGVGPEFWLGLQADHDIEVARRSGVGADVEPLAA
jgi:addiction module HigA family antidote